MKNDVIDQSAQVIIVQKEQKVAIEKQIANLNGELRDLTELNLDNQNNVEELIAQAESLCRIYGTNPKDVSEIDSRVGLKYIEIPESNDETFQHTIIDIVEIDDTMSWEEYISNIHEYAEKHQIYLSQDPFESLLTEAEKLEIGQRIKTDYMMKKASCDKYDYLMASFCGVATGLIDSFFVGKPGSSILGDWTDRKTDSAVEAFAKMVWKSDKKKGLSQSKKEPSGIASAIGYLERRFKVNYDARYASDLELNGKSLDMSTKNHHLRSLGHSPDIIGLFFSILDQFTDKASLISDGRLIRVTPVENKQGFELRGNNLISKIFCGFANWMGHIISDMAGSSGVRGHSNASRGAGVPLPFFEMFQFCTFGSVDANGKNNNLAELMTDVFESGYDARHGITMAIPVTLNEILIKLCWAIKRHYYHDLDWKECIPFGSQPELRRMLITGHGALCLVDGTDAVLRSNGNALDFMLHINSVAWSRFTLSALIEVRAMYKENSIDIVAIEKEMQLEWQHLFDMTMNDISKKYFNNSK